MQTKTGYRIIVLGLIVFIVSCGKIPNGVLSESEMQKVLTDIHIAESMVTSNYTKFDNDSARQALFQAVFKKHRITQAEYDSSLSWYARNLDIYIRIYDRIKLDIDQQIKDLGDVQAKAAPSFNQDSLNIWPRRTSLIFRPNVLFNGVTFDITPDVDYSSGSTLVLGMHVWGLPEKMHNFPEIRLSADQGDTILTVNNKILHDGYQEIILRTVSTKRVRRVYGHIRLDNTDADYYKVYVDSLNLMKYNYGTIPGFEQAESELEIEPELESEEAEE